jgi:Asp-tRNA(Asn)/Glu-tRNA(Gln) amidotransferase A subunit family amidase
VEDCAAVFAATHGPDGKDPTIRDVPFNWDARRDLKTIRVGYYKSAFDATENHPTKSFDDAALDVLRTKLRINPIAIETPTKYPVSALRFILAAESAAAFDALTRGTDDDLIKDSSWPDFFRQSRFIPAVEYLQANRVRTLVMQEMDKVMQQVDVFITPSFGGNVLLLTNLTGHPAVVLPNGFNADGTPVSISFIGRLFGEVELLRVAQAFQDATGFHLKRPPLFAV